MKENCSIFWFRRDLRFRDNVALFNSLAENQTVIPIFIFDENIINELNKNDARISFIYKSLWELNNELLTHDSSLLILKGKPIEVFESLITKYEIQSLYFNKDYEPYATQRDREVKTLLNSKNIQVHSYKDQVIFEENEILKADGTPYTVFTPYKNKWLQAFQNFKFFIHESANFTNFIQKKFHFPKLEELGFEQSDIKVRNYNLNNIHAYAENRDFPAKDASSYLSVHLRFGTLSIRELIRNVQFKSDIFLSELIWREFFMQILFHFPKVVNSSFKEKYNHIAWRNNETEFELWKQGKTGYLMVDAGMRELNTTGYMHNRVRMVTASFLCKHLLIDWRWGEAYFASKLLDFELSANNGNWQWAAGTGCDAAPYFRIFNPSEQLKKFDKQYKYIQKWVPEIGTMAYPHPIVEHKMARQRALETYKIGLAHFSNK